MNDGGVDRLKRHMRKKIQMSTERIRVARLKEGEAQKVCPFSLSKLGSYC